MKSRILISGMIVLAMLSMICLPGRASEDTAAVREPYKSSLLLIYVKSGNTRSFQVALNYFKIGCPLPVKYAKLAIMGGLEADQDLGGITTNDRGKVVFNLKPEVVLTKDEEGFYTVSMSWEGNDSIAPASAEVKFQDALLTMELRQEDTIRTVHVNAFSINDKAERVPLPEATVSFYVGRWFSNLKIGELPTDSAGQCVFDFPGDLPGDSTGNLKVIARIDEHELYGNVEAAQTIRWGIPTMHKVPVGFRALWSQIAPTWMVWTLTVLLLGVWGHYVYAIFMIRRIHAEGKEEEEKVPDRG